MGVFGFSQNETGVTSVAMANNIVGVVLFEEHCSNMSRDIADCVLYCFSGTIYDVITFFICIIQKRKYLHDEKRYSKKENAILLYFEKPFK